MIRFLDLERNPCNRDYTAAGRCTDCGETFTTTIAGVHIEDTQTRHRADVVQRELEVAHRCQPRGEA